MVGSKDTFTRFSRYRVELSRASIRAQTISQSQGRCASRSQPCPQQSTNITLLLLFTEKHSLLPNTSSHRATSKANTESKPVALPTQLTVFFPQLSIRDSRGLSIYTSSHKSKLEEDNHSPNSTMSSQPLLQTAPGTFLQSTYHHPP